MSDLILCGRMARKQDWILTIIVRIPDYSAWTWSTSTLQWRHNERDNVSNHQPHDCLHNHLFRRRSKKTSKLRVTGLCAENSPVTGEFPAQKASDADTVSTRWRRHDDRRWICSLHPISSQGIGYSIHDICRLVSFMEYYINILVKTMYTNGMYISMFLRCTKKKHVKGSSFNNAL